MPVMTARRQAQEHMALNKFVGEPRRVADTHCKSAPAWTIAVTDTGAVNVMPAESRYRCFTRTWWIRNPSWPNGREPGAGPRKYHGKARNLTETEAQSYCRAWNESHDPGEFSRKCEYESY